MSFVNNLGLSRPNNLGLPDNLGLPVKLGTPILGLDAGLSPKNCDPSRDSLLINVS